MQPAAETDAPPPSVPARPSPRIKKALVLLNEKAGSVGPKAGEQMDAALKAAGVEQFAVVDATRMSKQLL